MTTSGTVGQTSLDVTSFIEHAARRAGGLATTIAGEQLDAAKESLYFMLSHLSNKGVNLWCVEKQLVGIYPNQVRYAMSAGTVDIMKAFYRTMTRPAGAAAASSGVAANAFDGLTSTTCAQGGINGNISIDYGASTPQVISTVGLLPGTSGALTPVIEYSNDGIAWSTAYSFGAVVTVAGQWLWYDIDPSYSGRFWRIRETAGGTLNVEELFFGNTPQEIPMTRMNMDDYLNLPNKNFSSSSRALQYWTDRQLAAPVLNVWPVPTNTFDVYSLWRHRHVQDIGALTNTIEIPQRWGEAILNGFAYKMALELPAVDPARRAEIKALAEQTFMEVSEEERDKSPIKLAPAIGVYTA